MRPARMSIKIFPCEFQQISRISSLLLGQRNFPCSNRLYHRQNRFSIKIEHLALNPSFRTEYIQITFTEAFVHLFAHNLPVSSRLPHYRSRWLIASGSLRALQGRSNLAYLGGVFDKDNSLLYYLTKLNIMLHFLR